MVSCTARSPGWSRRRTSPTAPSSSTAPRSGPMRRTTLGPSWASGATGRRGREGRPAPVVHAFLRRGGRPLADPVVLRRGPRRGRSRPGHPHRRRPRALDPRRPRLGRSRGLPGRRRVDLAADEHPARASSRARGRRGAARRRGWLDVPSLAVARVTQTYRREPDGPHGAQYVYADPTYESFAFTVDPPGVVREYQGLFARVA